MPRGLVLLALLLALLSPLQAAPAPRLAILVVGPWAKSQSPDETQLLRRVEELLAEVGKPQVRPVRYHFDVPQERKYCEGRLGIEKEDLLFVGVVQLDARGAVTKVLDRFPKAQANVEVSAQKAVYQWRQRSGLLPAGE